MAEPVAAPAGSTLDISGVTTTTTQDGQTVTVTISGSGVETVPISRQLTLPLGTTGPGTVGATAALVFTVTDNRSTEFPVGNGLVILSGTLDDGAPVTVSADGTQVTFPA